MHEKPIHWVWNTSKGGFRGFADKRDLGKKDGVDVFEVGLRTRCTLGVGGAFLLTQISKANKHCNTLILLIIVTIIDTQFLAISKKKKKLSGTPNLKNPN